MYNLRRPPPSVIWKSRWPPLTVRHAISQPWPHGKIGDCEQSISFSIPWARLRVSLIVAYGIAAGRVEFEAALEEVLEGRSLDASLSNSLTLPFVPSSTLSTADKMAAEDTTCDLAIWREHVIPAELAPGRLNEFYFRSLNIIYIGKFKRNLLTFRFKGLS